MSLLAPEIPDRPSLPLSPEFSDWVQHIVAQVAAMVKRIDRPWRNRPTCRAQQGCVSYGLNDPSRGRLGAPVGLARNAELHPGMAGPAVPAWHKRKRLYCESRRDSMCSSEGGLDRGPGLRNYLDLRRWTMAASVVTASNSKSAPSPYSISRSPRLTGS